VTVEHFAEALTLGCAQQPEPKQRFSVCTDGGGAVGKAAEAESFFDCEGSPSVSAAQPAIPSRRNPAAADTPNNRQQIHDNTSLVVDIFFV
jgi:hypothetical protein